MTAIQYGLIAAGISLSIIAVTNVLDDFTKERNEYVTKMCEEKQPDGSLPYFVYLPRKFQVGSDVRFKDVAICRVPQALNR